MKKLALFLALCLLVTSIGLAAFAGGEGQNPDVGDAPAVDEVIENGDENSEALKTAPEGEQLEEDEDEDEKKEEDKEIVEEKKEDEVEEKKDDEVEEKKDDEVEEKKDDEVDEKKDDEVDEKKDDEVEEKKDDEVEEKKDDVDNGKENEIVEDKKDEIVEDKKEVVEEKTEEQGTPVEQVVTETPVEEQIVTETPVEEQVEETPVEEAEVVEEEKEEETRGGASDGTFIINDDGWIVGFEHNTNAIVFPQSVKGISVVGLKASAFSGNTQIETVFVPFNVQMDWAPGCFKNCSNLKSVTIENNSTYIPQECFMNCTSLTSCALPSNLFEIGADAFNGCTALSGIAFPTGLGFIYNSAFANCGSIQHIVFPAGLQYIDVGAFSDCVKLQEILIPDSVYFVGGSAFLNCVAATTLHWPTGCNAVLNKTFYGCMLLSEIALPNGVTEVGEDAFNGCTTVKMIRLPGTLTTVGANAFNGRPDSSWMRWDNCPGNAYIAADGLGTAGYLLAPINSPAHVYAKAHGGIHFCSTLTRDYVERCYNVLLNRGSDEAGLLGWCAEIIGGKPAVQIVKNFTDSAEFINRKLSVPDTIECLYQCMLNRASDPGGKADWQRRFDIGMTKDAVINGFAGSQEFNAVCAAYLMNPGTFVPSNYRDMNEGVTGFVSRCYTEALQRPWDPTGLENWCKAILTKKMTAAQVAYGFIFSPEFIAKKFNNVQFLDRLYHTYFDRDGDPAGIADWLTRMAAGWSRERVNNGFTGSQEWINLLKRYGLVK